MDLLSLINISGNTIVDIYSCVLYDDCKFCQVDSGDYISCAVLESTTSGLATYQWESSSFGVLDSV